MGITSYVCLFLIIETVVCGVLPKKYTTQRYIDNPAIQRFRKYVQIDTSKEENLDVAVEFLRQQAEEVGLVFQEHRGSGKPVCVLTWPGTDDNETSILLNSHMDVVAVEPEFWKYPPFSAEIDENGDIFGRGTQDDKDVAIQYIEAIRKLKQSNVTLKRTLHLSFMPDEESGGARGMRQFVNTKEFADLKVGFALDEGLTSIDDTMYVTYQDKRAWQIQVCVKGESGHSSAIIEDTAVEKLYKIMSEIDKYRQEQKNVMAVSDPLDYAAYDSVNINILRGDVAVNVIPGKMCLVVDVRWTSAKDVYEMQDLVDSWVAPAGNGTQLDYIRRVEQSDATSLDDSCYWNAIQELATDMGWTIKPVVCPAISDMVWLRNKGIPALGFAAKTHTVSHIHGANEYLNAETFLRGIEVYVGMLQKLGNL